jgi:ubiquinone/menaquinone biosynthesis C-methylase UbiE
MTRFDLIAPYYDWIKRVFFGHALDQFPTQNLANLQAGKSHLIIGPGSGKLIKAIADKCEPRRIDAIEVSNAMTSLSERVLNKTQVAGTIVNRAFPCSCPMDAYDYIHLPFILDCIPVQEIDSFLKACKLIMTPEGRLLISDFNPKTMPNGLLYFAYNRFAQTGNSITPDFERIITEADLNCLKRRVNDSKKLLYLEVEIRA